MKIGILGGSFDPPHLGHLELARQILKKTNMKEVWLMPCFVHAFDKKLMKKEHRVNMVKFLKEGNIRISDFEIRSQLRGYTIDTLNKLSKTFRGEIFFWIMGSDQIPLFPKYKNWKEILQKYNIIIFPRPSDNNTRVSSLKKYWKLKRIPKNVMVLSPKKYKVIDVSSTEIRKRVKARKPISDLVPKKVEEYIVKNRLYMK